MSNEQFQAIFRSRQSARGWGLPAVQRRTRLRGRAGQPGSGLWNRRWTSAAGCRSARAGQLTLPPRLSGVGLRAGAATPLWWGGEQGTSQSGQPRRPPVPARDTYAPGPCHSGAIPEYRPPSRRWTMSWSLARWAASPKPWGGLRHARQRVGVDELGLPQVPYADAGREPRTR